MKLITLITFFVLVAAQAGASTTYYISATGHDSNAGTSIATAWKSVNKLQSGVYKPGDKILLEGGKTFTGCLKLNQYHMQGTRAAPITVGSYGTGKFILQANCAAGAQTAAITLISLTGFTLQDAIIIGNNGATVYGVWIYNYLTSETGGITVQNSDISGFYSKGKGYGSEIFISSANATIGSMRDIKILNNVLHGRNGPTSPDDNGIMGYGHGNIRNVLYQGNHVYDIGSHANAHGGTVGNGIVAIGVDGGVLQNNVVHDLGANSNTCGGPGGVWTIKSNNVVIQYNEAYNIRPKVKTTGCDWVGFDIDMDVTNSVIQYNYSHHNYGPGFLVFSPSGTTNNNTIRYNISESDGAGFGINLQKGKGIYIYNNTVLVGGSGSLISQPIGISFGGNAPDTGFISNNNFYAQGNAVLMSTNGVRPLLKFSNNNYYSTGTFRMGWAGVAHSTVSSYKAASGESSALNVNPFFADASSIGACKSAASTCASRFKLLSNSSLVGAGNNISKSYVMAAGPYDFYKNKIPHTVGSGYNVGAYGALPLIASDKISIVLSQQKAGSENARARISINGTVVANSVDVTELRSSVVKKVLNYTVAKKSTHIVKVEYLNDLTVAGGPDRNLYVEKIIFNGVDSGHSRTFFQNGFVDFAVGVVDKVVVNLSEDYYLGHALVAIFVDGVRGPTLTVTASHAAKATQSFSFTVAPKTSHTVIVSYSNDLTKPGVGDRNLYVDGISVNNKVQVGATASMLVGGNKSFTVAP